MYSVVGYEPGILLSWYMVLIGFGTARDRDTK